MSGDDGLLAGGKISRDETERDDHEILIADLIDGHRKAASIEERLLLLSDATRHHLKILYRAQLHGGVPPELDGPDGKPWAWPTESDEKPLEVGETVTFRMNGALMSGSITALIPHVGQIVVGFGTPSGAMQFATVPIGDVKRAEVAE